MENPQIWSVSDVNHAVREIVEGALLPFWMAGEVGSLTLHRSGHAYFTMKDAKSQIRAVYFGGAAACTRLGIANGSMIEAFGNLSVYEVRGEYQFGIRQLRPAGVGDLRMRFEELKRRLAAEGLFDQERKRPIPKLPGRIGVVTPLSECDCADLSVCGAGGRGGGAGGARRRIFQPHGRGRCDCRNARRRQYGGSLAV